MATTRNKRWRLLADLPVQGGLLVRVCAYWVIFQLAHVGTIAIFDFLSGGQGEKSGALNFISPAMIVSFLFLPVAMLEITAFSNRFVGPLVSFRRKMKALSNGEPVDEIIFRPGDFYQDLGESFNLLRNRLELEEQRSQPENSEFPEGLECHV